MRGVGENAIVQPLAAVANAIHDATGIRLYSVPMSPPRVLEALQNSTESPQPLRDLAKDRNEKLEPAEVK